MIKIIKGTYGYVDEHGYVRPKTEKDGPLSLTSEQEARLVGLGVAVYVDADPTAEKPDAAATLDPEQLEGMTNAKLKELAEDMGIDTGKLKTKATLIEAITSVGVDPGPVEDDGDELPEFDPAEAVE